MPLRAPVVALLLLALAAPAAGAAAVPRSAAKAVLDACERSTDELDRAAVFEGQMRTIAGASRMQMRFEARRVAKTAASREPRSAGSSARRRPRAA